MPTLYLWIILIVILLITILSFSSRSKKKSKLENKLDAKDSSDLTDDGQTSYDLYQEIYDFMTKQKQYTMTL